MRNKAIRYLAGHLVCILLAAAFLFLAYRDTVPVLQGEMTSYFYDDYRIPDDCVSVYKPSETGEDQNRISRVKKQKEDEEEEEEDTGDTREDGEEEKKETELELAFREGKEQRFRGVIARLKEAYPYDLTCRLEFQNRAGNFDFNCHVDAKLPKGEKVVYFSLPEDRYYDMTGLRIDFTDSYEIEEVLIHEQQLSGVCSPADHFSRRSLWIFFLAALFCLECVRYFLPNILQALPGVGAKIRRKLYVLPLAILGIVNGAIAGDAVFRVTGAGSSPFWMAFGIVFCCLTVLEVCLLIPRTPKQKRRPSAGTAFFWLMVMGILVLIAPAWRDGLREAAAELDSALIWIPLGALMVQILLLALLYRKHILLTREDKVSFQKAWLFVIFVIGLSYLLLFLPFISPDEPSHYLSAYRVSDILLGQIGQLGNKRLFMRMEDYSFYAQRRQSLSAAYFIQTVKQFRLFVQDQGYVIADGPMVTNAIFSYFPAGIGIAAARILNLSPVMTFYAGRLGNLVFFLLVMRHLMEKLPRESTALFAITMLPMTLHTVGSYSYDGPTLCFAALFVAQVMVLRSGRGAEDPKAYSRCIFYGMLLGPSKLVYIPLLALIFLVPGRNLSGDGDSRRALGMKCGVVAAGLVSMVLIMLAVNRLGADAAIRTMVEDSGSVHLVNWGDHEEGYTIALILQHPLRYLVMCIRTFVKMSDYYVYTLAGTKLGWLNVDTSSSAAALGLFAVFLAANLENPDQGPDGEERTPDTVDGPGKIWIALLCGASMMITLLAMALDWTPLSRNYIMGVQGRYFLPLLLPCIWVFRTPIVRVGGSFRRTLLFYEAAANILILVYVFLTYMI